MDIIYGKEKLLPRVDKGQVLEEYRLALTFNNGEKRIFDAAGLLDTPAYGGLREVFNDAGVAFGTVVWPGEIDISPDMLYLNSMPETDRVKNYEIGETDLPGNNAEKAFEDMK